MFDRKAVERLNTIKENLSSNKRQAFVDLMAARFEKKLAEIQHCLENNLSISLLYSWARLVRIS